jgi:DNA-binding transcriptional LysR family regulator
LRFTHNTAVDLYQLRYFREVARSLNFTRAAEALGVSPSAVSRSVALLERSVRRPLFVRTRRRVALTAHGEALKARADAVFDQVETAEAELAGAGAAPAVLRVASREMITNYLLPGPLKEFGRLHGTRFVLRELSPQALAAALRDDRFDLGFGYHELEDAAVESRLLGRLRSHLYAARGYKGAAPFVAPRDFDAPPGAPRPDGWPDAERPRDIRYEAEFLETHRRFVLDGLCVGVLPDLVVAAERRRGEVKALPGPALRREVWCYRRKGRPLAPAVEELAAGVRRALR